MSHVEHDAATDFPGASETLITCSRLGICLFHIKTMS